MKKIYISMAAVFAAAAACVTQSFAAAPSITVKSDKSDVAYTYKSSNDSAEASADASKLFDSFNGVSVEDYTSAALTITSESDDLDNIEVVLRFSTDKTDMEYSVLDYYDFKITDENGDIIYDSDDTDPTEPDASEKDISFGVFNTESASDTKKFIVDYKIDETSSANIDEEDLEALNISVISQIVSDVETEADYSVTITAETPEIIEVVAAASDSSDGSEDDTESTVIEYQATCGVDLSAGRYTVTGKGILTIAGADGAQKSVTVIKDDTVPDIEGVTKAIVTITDGDKITALPLDGEEKPSVKFVKTSLEEAAQELAASEATEAPTETPAPVRTPEPRKSNPRTGEESAQAVVLCSVMFTAAAAICILEVIKRKKTRG
ncbi:MAG: hypothetical protein J1G06_09785 [Oscillospiraceae bacterium]|nr:hypothetical protein [Oscillospiraceae bacterium]